MLPACGAWPTSRSAAPARPARPAASRCPARARRGPARPGPRTPCAPLRSPCRGGRTARPARHRRRSAGAARPRSPAGCGAPRRRPASSSSSRNSSNATPIARSCVGRGAHVRQHRADEVPLAANVGPVLRAAVVAKRGAPVVIGARAAPPVTPPAGDRRASPRASRRGGVRSRPTRGASAESGSAVRRQTTSVHLQSSIRSSRHLLWEPFAPRRDCEHRSLRPFVGDCEEV